MSAARGPPADRAGGDPGQTPSGLKPGGLQQRRQMNRRPLQIDVRLVAAEQQPEGAGTLISDGYSVLEQLGQGSMAVVRHATRKADGKEVALKTTRKTDAELTAILREEYELLREMDHPHIIKAFDMFETSDTLVLVMELFGGGTLKQAVLGAEAQYLEEAEGKQLCLKLFQAIDYMHRRRILHRDVKPANILVSSDLAQLKLIDFNTARHLMEGNALTLTGTYQYMAPEVLQGESPSEYNDVWSSGLCVYFMLSGRVHLWINQFAGLEKFADAVANHPVTFKGKRWCSVTAPCKEVLRSCLEINKFFRPTPMAVLEREWFRSSRAANAAPSPPLKRSASCHPALRGPR